MSLRSLIHHLKDHSVIQMQKAEIARLTAELAAQQGAANGMAMDIADRGLQLAGDSPSS